MANGSGSPCGACKFLRRKCAADCIFAPYFCTEQGPARFAAIHKVFGASNVSKMLLHVPVPDRCEAVVTIAYEAQARIKDPVYGCVAHIFALQQQVAYLQAQLMQVKSQLAQNLMDSSRNAENHQWPNNIMAAGGAGAGAAGMMMGSSAAALFPPTFPNYNANPISPQSSICSLESMDPNINNNHFFGIQEIRGRVGDDDDDDDYDDDAIISFQECAKKIRRSSSQTHHDLGELQALALRMMKN